MDVHASSDKTKNRHTEDIKHNIITSDKKTQHVTGTKRILNDHIWFGLIRHLAVLRLLERLVEKSLSDRIPHHIPAWLDFKCNFYIEK